MAKLHFIYTMGNGLQYEDYREETHHLILNDNEDGRAEIIKLIDAIPDCSPIVIRGEECQVIRKHTEVNWEGDQNGEEG